MVGSERKGLIGKARGLQSHRAPVRSEDHLKRKGGTEGLEESGSREIASS